VRAKCACTLSIFARGHVPDRDDPRSPSARAGCCAGAYTKTQGHLKVVCGHWGLDDAGDILPHDIAPRVGDALVAPSDWPAKFADEVRKQSGLTMGRREVAMRYLGDAMAARRSAGEGSAVVTSADLKLAVKEMEKVDTALFGGEEMMAAVEQAGEEDAGQGEYAQGGTFTLGTHFR
jgi:hypothetical protein